MRHFKSCMLFVLTFCSLDALSQANEKVEMADLLRQDGKIYTVVLGVVVILTAMIVLLIRVDKKISRLERDIKKGK